MDRTRISESGSLPLESKALKPLLVAASDATKLLCISGRTLWSLSVAGKVPSIKIGRRRLYPYRELEMFVEKCKTPGTLAV
jgi:hypothetical protein